MKCGDVFLRDWCVFIYQERLGCMCVECMSVGVEGERGVFLCVERLGMGVEGQQCISEQKCICVFLSERRNGSVYVERLGYVYRGRNGYVHVCVCVFGETGGVWRER